MYIPQDGHTALYYAEQYGRQEHAAMLKAAGANDTILCQVRSPSTIVDIMCRSCSYSLFFGDKHRTQLTHRMHHCMAVIVFQRAKCRCAPVP